MKSIRSGESSPIYKLTNYAQNFPLSWLNFSNKISYSIFYLNTFLTLLVDNMKNRDDDKKLRFTFFS